MKTVVNTIMLVMFALGIHAATTSSAKAETNKTANKFTVEILNTSPEFKAGENETIEMNSAIMVRQQNSSTELFGSFWAELEVKPGNSSDVYVLDNWKLNDIRLAEDLSDEEIAQIEEAFTDQFEELFSELPKNEIDKALRTSGKHVASYFNQEAPLVIYSNQPSALISIDGDPYYEELDKRYARISNAGAFMIKDNNKGEFYMYGGGLWFSSDNALEGWEYNDNVPNRINRVMKKHARDLYDNMQNDASETRMVPQIIVSTEPAELISTNGNATYQLISEALLAYVENTDAEVFKDITNNRFYSLFSGRWFSADRLEGKWEYVLPGDLPEGFADIPEDHDKSYVLVSVPGTKAAEDAIKEAQIPSVTKKDIASTLDTKIEYDGEPEFEAIDGTELEYAVNTSSPVVMWNNRYYLVEDAAWYHSANPYGPWQIAVQRPVGVEDIPADNPLYNIKYVYVYKSTDDEVYTGYTSGYTGSYVDGETVVYGTGHHYSGWHGSYYYHHPMTYGFGFYYDSYYGWGPYYSPWYHSSFYWHWHWRPWYGYRPPHYRPPHHRPPGHRPPGNRPPHHRPKPEQPIARPDRPNSRPTQPSTRPSQPSTRPTQPSTRPTQPSTRPSQPSMRPSQPSTRPSQPSMRPSQPSMRPSAPAARPAMRPSPSRMR